MATMSSEKTEEPRPERTAAPITWRFDDWAMI